MRLMLLLALLAAPAAAQEPAGPQLSVWVEFDPAATAALHDLGEWVEVGVHYQGEPFDMGTVEHPTHAVLLGSEQILIAPESQLVRLAGNLHTAAIGATMPILTINVHSSGMWVEGNLLDCDVLTATLVEAARPSARNVVSCRLRGG